MDGGRINVYTDHGESYKCAEKERERVFALPVFIVKLLYITSTHTASLMFPN